jgi:hypothetical protein
VLGTGLIDVALDLRLNALLGPTERTLEQRFN